MKWTHDQQKAIEAPKPGPLSSQTLLVAAAAGSGKTAVLVERIISRLRDKTRPLSISELLVVTFTKAAAAEMSARIGAKLSEVYGETGDTYLEEQLHLLPSAHISTLHSFCQWVIKSYFYRLDIDPAFRIGNEGELQLMRSEVLDDVLLQAYTNNDYHIFEVADMLSDNRSDERLKHQLLRIYDFALAQSDPQAWLDKAYQRYESAMDTSLLETIWGQAFWQEQQDIIARIESDYETMVALINRPDGPAPWQSLVDEVAGIREALRESENWDAMHAAVALAEKHRFGAYRKTGFKKDLESGAVDAGIVSQVEALGKQNKERLQAMAQGPFAVDEATFKEQLRGQLPYAQGIIGLVQAFDTAFKAAKRRAGLLDFSDLEHLCLALLRDKDEDGNWHPSSVALELQEQFKEVMVDEYQDTNGVQEAIVNLVSRRDNRFYVGDVKQSIYRFRMADPTLFMEKYHRFGRDEADVERRIDLAQNFRSHENILSFTNFLFRQIMTEEGAELSYGDEEALYPGRLTEDMPEDWVGGPVELHLIEVDDTTQQEASEKGASSNATAMASDGGDDADELENDEKEIAFIIEKLQALKAAGVKIQEKDGSFRPMCWRDVVILLRSVAGKANRMVEAMRIAGIPAYAEENSGYFSSLEVQLLIALLQVIDNPEQDLPMAAVLGSFIVGLDANALGRLRMQGDGSLWSLLPTFAGKEDNPAVMAFIERFTRWRTLSRRRSVSELLWHIFEDINYVEYVSAMPNGLVRRANVLALYDRAKQYEAGSFRGLFRFLRFIESLQAAGEDLSVARTVSEADDVVRIMSIHKSKGLEFPIVFLSSVQKKFNMRDLMEPILLHKDGGLGLKGYYPDYRVMYGSLPWLYNRRLLAKAAKAEEERILYVALTRARDKLFITGYVKNFAARCARIAAPALVLDEQQLPADLILGGNSYLDWLLLGLGRHLEGNSIRLNSGVEDIRMPNLKDKSCRFTVAVHDGSAYTKLRSTSTDAEMLLHKVYAMEPLGAEPLPEAIAHRFAFSYAYPGAVITPAKISVSEIKRRFAEAEALAATSGSIIDDDLDSTLQATSGETGITAEEQALPNHEPADGVLMNEVSVNEGTIIDEAFAMKPVALSEEAVTGSGARWGTLMHEAMQWLPLQPYTKESLKKALDNLVLAGYMTMDERQVLNETYLRQFYESALGQRMLTSPRVEREWPFSRLVSASDVYPQVEQNEQLFLQGIIDTAFEEDGAWVLVDYKTDKVRNADELRQRYRLQLRIYKEALEQLTGMPVKETYIYSFRLREAVRLDV